MEHSIARVNDYLQLKNCARGTCYRYSREIRLFLAFSNVQEPDLLAPFHVRNYLLFLLEEGMAPSSCKMTLAVLRTFFNVGLQRPGALNSIPWPKVPIPLPDIWSTDELVKLFSVIRSLRLRTLLLTAYATGMRISEVCHLQVSDIDRARGVIRVRHGKGDKARFVPLPPSLLKHLGEFWQLYRPAKPFLFPGVRSGSPLPNKVPEAGMAQAVSLCGVNKKATPHTLRHCFATHALENGMDLHTLQMILGHASIRTTQRYLHLSTLHISQARSPMDLLNLPSPLEVVR